MSFSEDIISQVSEVDPVKEQKFCALCEFQSWNSSASMSGDNTFICQAKQNETGDTDLVTGKPIYKVKSCYEARSTVGSCSREGHWFVNRLSKYIDKTKLVPTDSSPLEKLKAKRGGFTIGTDI